MLQEIPEQLEKLVEFHQQQQLGWTLTYCDLLYFPVIFNHLQQRSLVSSHLVDTVELEKIAANIVGLLNPEMIANYCQYIETSHSACVQKSHPQKILELYFLWIHLYAIGYALAKLDVPEAQEIAQQLNDKIVLLNHFVEQQHHFPLPKGWLQMVRFLHATYSQSHPNKIVIPQVKEIVIKASELYRFTHLIMQKSDYLCSDLPECDHEIILQMIQMFPQHYLQHGDNIDATAEFFLSLRACSGYASDLEPKLDSETKEYLEKTENNFLQELPQKFQELQQIPDLRLRHHSYITIPLYLLVGDKNA